MQILLEIIMGLLVAVALYVIFFTSLIDNVVAAHRWRRQLNSAKALQRALEAVDTTAERRAKQLRREKAAADSELKNLESIQIQQLRTPRARSQRGAPPEKQETSEPDSRPEVVQPVTETNHVN